MATIRLFFTVCLFTITAQCLAIEKVTFQLDWLPGGDKAPVYVGIAKGYFAEVGLEVKIASGKGSTDAITKLAIGRSDIGSVGLGALLAAKARHQVPVSAVYSIYTKPPHAFLTTEDKGVKVIADLKGKKVATSPFTSSNVFLPLILAENNLNESDLTVIKADPGALGPLLATGRVDAIIEWITNSPRHLPQLKKMNKRLTILPWAEAGMDIYATSLVGSDAFLTQRPEVAKKFVIAFAKAIEFVQANPEAAAKIVNNAVSEVPVDTATQSILYFTQLSANEVTESEGAGSFNPTRLAATWSWVARAQSLDPNSLDPEIAVNRNFALQAEKNQ